MQRFDINPFLEHVLSFSPSISDVNFSVGRSPQVEINGTLTPVPTRGMARLAPYQTEQLALHLLQGRRDLINKLVRTGSVDLSYAIPGRTRFRVNIFAQRGTYAIVLRVIPQAVPTLADLNLPDELGQIVHLRTGLVLVTGPTGSGKSTTLAAIINEINQQYGYHIVTIEDPIEYLHKHQRATVNQREVGTDSESFALALRAALRQAPKVILVGEMRDVETIETALEAAETGHLVLSTLHTIDAAKTIDRIVGVFPREEEQSIRTRFAQAFRYVVSQRLAPRSDVGGRVAILEVLKATARTREYIIKGETEGRSLTDAMRDGSMDGMQHFDGEIQRLVRRGVMTKSSGLSFATNPHNLALEMSDIPDNFSAPGPPMAAPTLEPALVGAAAGDGRPSWIE